MMLRVFRDSIRRVMRRCGFDIVRWHTTPHFLPPLPVVRPEFRHVRFSATAIQKLLDEYTFETVLDIGCGAGEHSDIFMSHGKKVTALDYGKSVYFERRRDRLNAIVGDFMAVVFDRQFDCVWASHVLEHQINPGLFLAKVFSVAKDGGVVCVTVPPMHRSVLGGHVSSWNAGLLLYQMVLAGFDCGQARILQYGWNISLIVQEVRRSSRTDFRRRRC